VGLVEFDFEYQTPLNGQRFSIRTAMELLAARPFERVPFIHWHIATVAELEHRLDQWATRRGLLPILYIAGHGKPGIVNGGEASDAPNRVTLEQVIDLIAERSRGCWLHVGSCAALGAHGGHLRSLLRRTSLVAISGYKRRVDYTLATAFELLLLEQLVNAAMDGRGLAAMRRWAAVHARGPFSPLGFRIVAD
jgi:hypothetical protein